MYLFRVYETSHFDQVYVAAKKVLTLRSHLAEAALPKSPNYW